MTRWNIQQGECTSIECESSSSADEIRTHMQFLIIRCCSVETRVIIA